jgi:transcriptional regulator with XRE-family HTH domain
VTRAATTSLGARIRAARDAAGMTQAALAEASGAAPNTVARIERGEQEPSAQLLGRIAVALGVSADHLLDIRPE